MIGKTRQDQWRIRGTSSYNHVPLHPEDIQILIFLHCYVLIFKTYFNICTKALYTLADFVQFLGLTWLGERLELGYTQGYLNKCTHRESGVENMPLVNE